MMNLLERYLADVRRNLPAREADDIVAELRDLLLARAEEEEETTGSVDWNALLRDFGHPLVVASRYRKQQWLIGPELYPFYVHSLKMIVGIALVVVTALSALKAAVLAADPGSAVVGYLGAAWTAAAVTVGSVTILFVVIERFARKSMSKCTHWKPSELPDVVDKRPSVYESVLEVGVGVLLLLWWIGLIRVNPYAAQSNFYLLAAPVWDEVFWPVTFLLAGRLAYNLVRWLRPRWSWLRGTFGIATAAGGLIIALAVARAGRWVVVIPVNDTTLEQAAGLQHALDLSIRLAIVAVIVVWTIGIMRELWRMTRSLRKTPLTT